MHDSWQICEIEYSNHVRKPSNVRENVTIVTGCQMSFTSKDETETEGDSHISLIWRTNGKNGLGQRMRSGIIHHGQDQALRSTDINNGSMYTCFYIYCELFSSTVLVAE